MHLPAPSEADHAAHFADCDNRVNGALDEFFQASARRAIAYGPQYVELWHTLHQNTAGGKLFRPRLVFTAYQALGGDDLDAAAWMGAAFELLHTALIVHDDVIDRDFVRRGQVNLSGRYRDRARAAGVSADVADHHGLSAAVVAGDLALFYSYRLVDRTGARNGTRDRLLQLMDDALFASAAGELLDVEFTGAITIPTVENILRMARLKTAVYSFEGPLQAGAILAGASDDIVTSLEEFGREVGTAYQIVDDLLGIFGHEQHTGKSATSDLREGKRTVLVAHAAETALWTSIEPLFGKPTLTEAQAEQLRSMFDASGAREYAERLVRQHAERAHAVLARPHMEGALRHALAPLVDVVLRRVR